MPITMTSRLISAPASSLIPDGLASAPSGSAQYPTLFTNANGGPQSIWDGPTNAPYAYRPPQTVPGVDFPVGINCNATASGNTITETGVLQAPTNNDKKTLYPQMGPGWPSGALGNLTAGTAYFLINVSGNTYQLSLTSGGSAVSLGTMPAQFIALKDPSNTANKPSGTTFNSGVGGSGTPDINVSGNNVTLDHWDMSLGGGCFTSVSGTPSNFVYQNNYFLNSPSRSIAAFNGGASLSNQTWQYNVMDGNTVLIPLNTTASTASGNNVLTFSSIPASIKVGMIVMSGPISTSVGADNLSTNAGIITVTALNSPSAGKITLSGNAIGTVNNGDTVYFGVVASYSGYCDLIRNTWDTGTTLIQYNWFKNSWAAAYQQARNDAFNDGSTCTLTEQYNVWENNTWGAQIAGMHGEAMQIWTPVLGENYGAVIHRNSLGIYTNQFATADTSHISHNASANKANYASLSVINNTIISVNGVADWTGNIGNVNAMIQINPTKILGTLTLTGNYIDPTSFYSVVGPSSLATRKLFWTSIWSGVGGANGPGSLTPTKVQSNNLCMIDGTTFGNPNGWGT